MILFESGVITALWTIISQVAGSSSEVNSAVALLTLSSNIGMLVGPPMAGLCISTFGWTAAALLVGGVSMAGAACIMLVKTDEHHPISSPTDDGAGIPRAAP